MSSLLIIETIFLVILVAGVCSFLQITNRKLKIQTIAMMIGIFLWSWWMEANGEWYYTESLLFLPGKIPIEIPLIYLLAVPIWVYLIGRAYESEVDSVTQFGAPGLLVSLGIVFFIVDGQLLWLSLFIGMAGLLVAERREIAIYVGIAAFMVEFIIEGVFLVNWGIVVWHNSYPLSTPIQFMFTAWALVGFIHPRRRE